MIRQQSQLIFKLYTQTLMNSLLFHPHFKIYVIYRLYDQIGFNIACPSKMLHKTIKILSLLSFNPLKQQTQIFFNLFNCSHNHYQFPFIVKQRMAEIIFIKQLFMSISEYLKYYYNHALRNKSINQILMFIYFYLFIIILINQ